MASPAAAGFLQDQGALRRAAGRVARHWRWGREQGFDRVLEEDQANPVERARLAIEKARWRRRHGGAPGEATAVFLVGVQRSGTNMVVRGLEHAPEVEVHNENSRRAFHRYELRDDAAREMVAASRHQLVLFKPLCDSHRIGDVMDGLGAPAEAIWAYRAVDGRVRSAVAKFGDVNLRVLREIAEGGGHDRWQRGGLTDDRLAQLAEFDWDALSAEDGAALFWYVRNSLLFDSGLVDRHDVTLVSYESVLADPAGVIAPLCERLGFPFRPELVAHVEHRAGDDAPALDLHPQVRALCTALHDRLEARRLLAGGDDTGTIASAS